MGYFRKGWGHGNSKGTDEERICGNSKGELKKKWNFQGCWRKTHVEFPWVVVVDFGISSKGCYKISKCESLFSPEFLRVKSGKSQNSRGGSEKYILNSPSLDFFCKSPIQCEKGMYFSFNFRWYSKLKLNSKLKAI